MKKLSVVLALCIIVVMAMGLTACSSYNALKKAFENAGYTESETMEAIAEDIREEAESESLAITVHGMSKIDGLSTTFVLIVEFKSVEDMKKMFDESETVKGIIKDVQSNEDAKELQKTLENSGFAKGNCLVLPSNPLTLNEVTNIVKNA